MALRTLSGLPGSGKTEYLTYLAIKHYKSTNNILSLAFNKYIRKMDNPRVNNVFTNYPVLLDRKRNIYSNKVTINDLDNSYSFPKHSFIGIDEPQLTHESTDHQSFPRGIGMFLQMHRHVGIDDIVFATQHPNRLVMYEKNIMTIYIKMQANIKIPFTPYKFLIMKTCYEIEDYELISTKNKDIKKMHNIKTGFKFYNAGKVHKHYDDKYLAPLNKDKLMLNKGTYDCLKLNSKDIEFYSKFFEENSVAAYDRAKQKSREKKGFVSVPKSTGSRQHSRSTFLDNFK